MNTREFTEWFRYHGTRFPSLMGWFAKFPTQSRTPIDVTQQEIRDAWESCLRGCEVDACLEATDAIFNGDEETPRSYEEHPRAIRRIVKAEHNERARNRSHVQEIFEPYPGETIEETQAATRAAVKEAIARIANATMLPIELRGKPRD